MGDWADDISGWEDLRRRDEMYTATCRYCGAEQLEWLEIVAGPRGREYTVFRLYNPNGTQHNCRIADPNEEFEDLDK